MLHVLGIPTDHIATNQLDTIKNQVTDDPKEHIEKRELRGNWLKVCCFLDIIHSHSIFPIFLITFLNSESDLLDLTKLGNLFQIKDPRKCTEFVP